MKCTIGINKTTDESNDGVEQAVLFHYFHYGRRKNNCNRKLLNSTLQRSENFTEGDLATTNTVPNNKELPIPVAARSTLRPLGCWDRGFESRSGHGYLSLEFVCCVILCR
jgi:hypothetical protein